MEVKKRKKVTYDVSDKSLSEYYKYHIRSIPNMRKNYPQRYRALIEYYKKMHKKIGKTHLNP